MLTASLSWLLIERNKAVSILALLTFELLTDGYWNGQCIVALNHNTLVQVLQEWHQLSHGTHLRLLVIRCGPLLVCHADSTRPVFKHPDPLQI